MKQGERYDKEKMQDKRLKRDKDDAKSNIKIKEKRPRPRQRTLLQGKTT
jgi:hypothetical protein